MGAAMKTRFFPLLATLLALNYGGCSNIGRLDVPRDRENIPSVRTIIQRVKCEIAFIAREDYEFKSYVDDGDWVIAIQLDLEVNDDGSLAPAFTYTNGIFSFNAGARLDVSRDQQFTEQLFFAISDIRDTMKADKEASRKLGPKIDSFACPTPDTNLAGDLGIVDSVHMAFLSDGLNTNTKLAGAKGAFGGNVNFIVVKNINAVGPTYTLTHFRGPGSLAGVSETNTDRLTFAFAQRSATGDVPKPSRKTKSLVANSAGATNAQAQALNVLSSIQTSQIANQLSGIRANIR